MPEITLAHLIDQALEIDSLPIKTALDACEVIYMHGFSDDQVGSVEEPGGHYYRVARWVVHTDSDGNRTIQEYTTEAAATDNIGGMVNETTGAHFVPWSGPNGERGFRVIGANEEIEYIYLNPSGASDDGSSDVFVYWGKVGDAAEDMPMHFYDVLTGRDAPVSQRECSEEQYLALSAALDGNSRPTAEDVLDILDIDKYEGE